MKFKNFWVQYKINGESFDCKIPDSEIVIGRAPDCDLSIRAEVLSRNHLRFSLEGQKVYVEDLGSTNGTFMNKEKLEPHKLYEYIAGKILFVYGDEVLSLSVTPLFKKTEEELELEAKEFELARQKEILNRKNQKLKREIKKENYIRVAGESVDSIYENLKYVAKSARFNKEKAISEAEVAAKQILEEALSEASEIRENLKEEIKGIEDNTKKEVKKILSRAKESAKSKIEKAKLEAATLKAEANTYKENLIIELENKKEEVLTQAEKKRNQIITEAQEMQSDIIANAYIKNKELKEENSKLIEQVTVINADKLKVESEIVDLQREHQENTQRAERSRIESRQEISNLNNLKLKVLDLENRGNEAKRVLESEIPGLENKLVALREEMIQVHQKTVKEKTELNSLISEIEQKEKELEKFEFKNSKAEERIDELNNKINEAEDNLFKLNRIKKERIEEVDREIATRRKEQHDKEVMALSVIEKKSRRADKEIEVNIAKAKERAIEIINLAKIEKENIDKLVEERKKQIEKEVLDQLSDAQKETKELREQAKQEIEAARANLNFEVQEEKGKLLATVKEKSTDLLQKAEQEAAKIVEEARTKADSDISKLEKEIKERRRKTDDEIHEIRTNVIQKLEEQKKQFELDEQQRAHVRVMRLKKELNDVLRARIVPFLKDKEQIDKIGNIIEKSVNTIMLDDVDDDFVNNENYSDIDPSLQQAQNKKFFIVSSVGISLVVLFLVLIPTFKKVAVDSSRNIASQMEEETKQKIEKVKKDGDLSKPFNPPKTETFHNNYTDRVLYTGKYVKIELNPNFREQWILELQDFFVDELRLNENNLVPFIAQEANLIRELDEEFKRINGNFAEKGIARMREIESDFIKGLRGHIKKDSDFKKVMDFKKKFFLENKLRFE